MCDPVFGLATACNPLQPVYFMHSGFDAAGHVVEEVKDYSDFPRAVIGCLLLTTLTYLLPILVGTSVNQNYDDWQDGYWGTIAGEVCHVRHASAQLV